jgi:hypothetical protein
MLSPITCSSLRRPDCEKAIGKCTWIPKRTPGCVDVSRLDTGSNSPKPVTRSKTRITRVIDANVTNIMDGLSQLIDNNLKLQGSANSIQTSFKIKSTNKDDLEIDSSKFGNKEFFRLLVTDTSITYLFKDKAILLQLSFNGIISGSASLYINVASGQDVLHLVNTPNKTLWFQIHTNGTDLPDLHCSIKVYEFFTALLQYAPGKVVSADVYNDTLAVPIYIPDKLYMAIGTLGTRITANVGDAIINRVMNFGQYFVRRY